MLVICIYRIRIRIRILYWPIKDPINEVEDEQHYLFTCPGMESKRKILYDTIEKSCINFKHLNNKNKLIWLLNTEDKNILLELCKFLCFI